MAAHLTIEPGVIIGGRYAVQALIGAGNYGAVYMAADTRGERQVAIKTLRPSSSSDPEIRRRFEREAEICEALQHPNVAALVDVGTTDLAGDGGGRLFLAFELARGLPIGALVDARGPMQPEYGVPFVIHVLDALEEAHQLGIIHRDIKPDNVLVLPEPALMTTPEPRAPTVAGRLGIPVETHPSWANATAAQIKVIDFGLGKLLEIGERKVTALTRAGVAAGTAEYMAPEQARAAADCDHRADIYAAGMLLHKLLVGRPAFVGTNALDVAMRQISEAPAPLPGHLSAHPVGDIIMKALAKDPNERYGSAAEMAWALRCSLDPSLSGGPDPDFVAPPLPRKKGLFRRLFGG